MEISQTNSAISNPGTPSTSPPSNAMTSPFTPPPTPKPTSGSNLNPTSFSDSPQKSRQPPTDVLAAPVQCQIQNPQSSILNETPPHHPPHPIFGPLAFPPSIP